MHGRHSKAFSSYGLHNVRDEGAMIVLVKCDKARMKKVSNAQASLLGKLSTFAYPFASPAER